MRTILIILSLFCLVPGYSQDTLLICHQEEVGLSALDNLNTKSIEFSPVYYQNGIVFVVARENNRFIDRETGQAYFDLMYADVGPDGTTGKTVSFSPNIRTQYHEGPCTFNSDGTELFFSRSGLSDGKGADDGTGKIYQASKGTDDWENVQGLPFNSDQYDVAHPALSGDGMYMVFTSNMPGGEGGMDLYISDRLTGAWSTPVNLGRAINSTGNEIFPNWHPSGHLLYASDGMGGEGGLDIYATIRMDNNLFSGVQHLDAPFNSSRDDLGLIVSADGMSGFIASDRKPTNGKDDLYRWSSPQSIFCSTPKPLELIHEITVRDDNSSAIENAYVWLIPMNQEGPAVHKEYFSTELVPKPNTDGAFYLRWGVTDTLSKASADAITSSMGRASLYSTPKATYILVVQHDGYEPYVEVFPQDVLPAEVLLQKLKVMSTNCFNTQFVIYNETGDLLLNGALVELNGACVKGVKLYTDESGMVIHCLTENCSVKANIEQEGYAPQSFTFTPTQENELRTVYLKLGEGLTVPPAPIPSGTVIVLDKIYYDFNKSEIRKGEAGELIALADVLKKYPDLKIELTSHTDTRGTQEYNMELSQRRSASSKSYLELLGIAGSRILTKAAGETMPRNNCVDGVPCSEAEHQFNRRTEVKIINPAEGMQVKYKSEG